MTVGLRPMSGREDFGCLLSRPPIPKSCPHELSAQEQQKILDARARTSLGPMRRTELTSRHRSTIWKVLKRHSQSQLRRETRQTFRRYEWKAGGAAAHDAVRLPRFRRPGRFAMRQRANEPKSSPGGRARCRRCHRRQRSPGLLRAALEGEREAVSATLKRATVWMSSRAAGRSKRW